MSTVVSVYLNDFCDTACAIAVPVRLHHEMDSVGHLRTYECVIQVYMSG